MTEALDSYLSSVTFAAVAETAFSSTVLPRTKSADGSQEVIRPQECGNNVCKQLQSTQLIS
jgi:hypothetical protein